MSTAFITVLLTNHYLPGALVLANQLSEFHPLIPRVVLISDAISSASKSLLATVFDELIVLESMIESQQLEKLELFQRPDLKFTLSKIYVFKLTQFDKMIYFDADVLPMKLLPSMVFDLVVGEDQIAAAPDASWPDIFNSGFLVLKPSLIKYEMMSENLMKSFDGADQGLLNEFFFKGWIRLPFLFNVTVAYSVNHYEYLPLLNHFKNDIYNVHFIGNRKPWFDREVSGDSTGFYQMWWNVFNMHFTDLAGDIFNSDSPSSSTIATKTITPEEQQPEKKPQFSGGPEALKLNESKIINRWDTADDLEKLEPKQEEVEEEEEEEIDYPPPIFPWEQRRVKATRVFAPESEYVLSDVTSKLSDLEIDEEYYES